MTGIHYKAAALLLAAATAFASPAAAFGAQTQQTDMPAHIRVASQGLAREKKTQDYLDIFDTIQFFDFSYDDEIDRMLFMQRLEKDLAAIAETGEGTKVQQLTAIVKALGKYAKQIKQAKASADVDASAGDLALSGKTLALLARLDYAQKRTNSVRKAFKRQLKAAKTEEQKALALQKAKEEEAARIAAANAAAAAAAANNYYSSQAASDAEYSEAAAEGSAGEEAAYAQEDAGQVEASQSGDISYENTSQSYDYDQEEEYEETTSSYDDTEAEEEEEEYTDGSDSDSYAECDETEACEEPEETEYVEDSSSENSEEDDDDDASYGGSATTGFKWPVSGSSITSGFGEREAPIEGASTYHKGIDIDASEGEDISAAASGTVSETGYNDAMGNYVVIDHGDGISTTYEHCSDVYAEEGQDVSQGETIAAVGSTGIATGSHLHFGVSVDGESVDPADYYYDY